MIGAGLLAAAWFFSTTTDPLTSEVRQIASLPGEGDTRLVVQCSMPGQLYVSVTAYPKVAFPSTGGKVEYRFDTMSYVEAQQWQRLNRKLVGTGEQSQARGFAAQMVGAKHVTIRMYDYNGFPTDFAFDLPEDGSAPARVTSDCR